MKNLYSIFTFKKAFGMKNKGSVVQLRYKPENNAFVNQNDLRAIVIKGEKTQS